MSQEKACKKCSKVKPLDQYYFSSGKYEAQCKDCRRAAILNKNHARAKTNTVVDQTGVKHCATCQTTKPKLEFSLRRGAIDGLSSDCKTCANSRVKAYYRSEVGLTSHLASRAQSDRIKERTGQDCELDRAFIAELLEKQEHQKENDMREKLERALKTNQYHKENEFCINWLKEQKATDLEKTTWFNLFSIR